MVIRSQHSLSLARTSLVLLVELAVVGELPAVSRKERDRGFLFSSLLKDAWADLRLAAASEG